MNLKFITIMIKQTYSNAVNDNTDGPDDESLITVMKF